MSCVGDSFLIRRYTLAEADLAKRRLAREEHYFLLGVCRGLNMDVDDKGAFRLRFTDFLYGTRRLRGKEWKLINQPLVDGYVLLTKDRFLRVVETHLQNRFEKELPLEVTEALLRAFEITSWSYGRGWKPGGLNSRPRT